MNEVRSERYKDLPHLRLLFLVKRMFLRVLIVWLLCLEIKKVLIVAEGAQIAVHKSLIKVEHECGKAISFWWK